MRIPCPHCGDRDLQEFIYLGDASLRRPDPNSVDAVGEFVAYVYLRNNSAGPHQEFWFHASGCHAWLIITRDTTTHEIHTVRSTKSDPVSP